MKPLEFVGSGTVVGSAGAQTFPFDPIRTSVVQLYHEPGMIADRVLPLTPPLGSPAFHWFRYMLEDAFVVPDLRLGRKSRPNQVEFEGERVEDRTEHYGLEDQVPQEDIDVWDSMAGRAGKENTGPSDMATLQMTRLLKLGREVRTSSLVFDSGSYEAAYQQDVAAADRFDKHGRVQGEQASDVLEVIEAALTRSILRPNVGVIGQEAWSALRRHPHVLAAVNRESGAENGMALPKAVGELLELDELLVGRSRVAMSEGEPLQLRRAWGKHFALIYRGSMPSGKVDGGLTTSTQMQTFGFTAVYQPLSVYSRYNEGWGIKGGMEIQVRESCKEVVSGGNGFGFLLRNVVS